MRGVGRVGFVNGRVAVGWRGGVEDGGGSKAVSGGVEKIGKATTRPWFVSYFATHRLGVPLAPLVFLPPRSLH